MTNVRVSAALLLAAWAGIIAAGAQTAPKPLTLQSMNENVNVRDPQFSPDGARLAVVSNKSGRARIWIMSAAGAEPHALLSDEGSESSPRWSRDGRSIAFLRTEGAGSRTSGWPMPPAARRGA